VLALRARPYLEEARGCDWSGARGVVPVVGAETAGAVIVRDDAGAAREVRFKADRVDRIGTTLRFTDYKTGKPLAGQKRLESREKTLREKVARGEALQAVAYAMSGGAFDAETLAPPSAEASAPVNTEGRYLFVRPGLSDEVRALDAQATAEFAEPFARAVQTALAAWDAGSLLPRLDLPDDGGEPPACQRCDVKEACVRGDSGVRQRMRRWIDSELRASELSPAARIFALAGESS
jgi:hypothetical protein